MDEEKLIGQKTKWALGALGLGAVAGAFTIPKYGVWIALGILILFLLLFGGYFFWQRMQARRRRERFSSALEAQAGAAPKSISDPNKRAALDKLRQKFQQGLREFKSRGKDIYALPWHVIIGEPGSGKSEAIRHSGVEFPAGMQDEMQGSGGTVNMDWWFTNRGIILDTAGSMIFNEAKAGESSEWKEFLKLLQRARPQCPINGLFVALSIESLIKDSADTIASKASRLAQQLDLIQRTLDVRFPVYLLVTKCDLLAGFREFFDNIDDPTLQHQIFGWSNPDPLDAPFRPELVEQYLTGMTQRLRRRRLALLRDTSPAGRLGGETEMFFSAKPLGGAKPERKRLDEVDSMVALTDSIMRLAPRLRRYLETIFVAGEWSAKPVFLRGIYFTSSMREGKALDEAIALATGLKLDDLPEDRSWSRDRAYFLRDLFVEKVFLESGLVTRATNTLQLLRKRQFAIFGTGGLALLLLLGFSAFGWYTLKKNIGAESRYWAAAANEDDWNERGDWSHAVVEPGREEAFHFRYTGTNLVKVKGADDLTLTDYHARLADIASKRFSVGWIFKPVQLLAPSGTKDRKPAQRTLFELSVLKPLIMGTRGKITREPDDASLTRYQNALLALIQFEADRYSTNNGYLDGTNAAAWYFDSFLSFLTDGDGSTSDDTNAANLVSVFHATYARGAGDKGREKGSWPPAWLSGGDSLSDNTAITRGLEIYRKANQSRQVAISNRVNRLNAFADALHEYQRAETNWLAQPRQWCPPANLQRLRDQVVQARAALREDAGGVEQPVTSLSARYNALADEARNVSQALFQRITANLPGEERLKEGLFRDIEEQLQAFASEAGEQAANGQAARSGWLTAVDTDYLALAATGGESQFEARFQVYTQACALESASVAVDRPHVGSQWKSLNELRTAVEAFRAGLQAYGGAYTQEVSAVCNRIAGQAERTLQERYVSNYVRFASDELQKCTPERLSVEGLQGAVEFLTGLKRDLAAKNALGEHASKVSALEGTLKTVAQGFPQTIGTVIRNSSRFPVVLNASQQPLTPGQLTELRGRLNGLKLAMVGDEAIQMLGQEAIGSVNRFSDLVNALLTPDGAVAEMTVSFVSPETGSADWRVASIFNISDGLQIAVGNRSSSWGDPFGASPATVSGRLNDPITVRFRRASDGQPEPFNEDSWPLIRMIASDRATQATDGDGTIWRCKIPVKVEAGGQTYEGNAVVNVTLKQPLPKPVDWPGR